MKRKARKLSAGRKGRILTEAELKKIAAGHIVQDVRDTWNREVSHNTREIMRRIFSW